MCGGCLIRLAATSLSAQTQLCGAVTCQIRQAWSLPRLPQPTLGDPPEAASCWEPLPLPLRPEYGRWWCVPGEP